MADPISATNSATLNNSLATQTTSLTGKVLGQKDFLKLLVAQLSAQDPLNPKKDTDFIAQMAQFSSLEQTKSMDSSLTSLRNDQALIQAYSLMGKTVELNTGSSTPVSGVVTGVKITDGKPQIVVNKTAYDLSNLLSVSQTQTTTP